MSGQRLCTSNQKPRRVVRRGQVNRLVRHQIPQHERRGHDETPVEGKILHRGTVAPFRSLPHHVNLFRNTLQPARDFGKVFTYFLPRLSAQPVFEARGW
jgi:hypothetical protein